MRSPVVLVIALALIALPLAAQSNDVAVWVGSSRVGTTNSSGSTIRFDRGDSFGVSFNHFWSSRFSGELAAFEIRHNGSIQIGGVNAFNIGHLRMTPVTATLQWHLGQFRRLDAHLGPGLAYVRSNSIHSADLDNAGVGRVKVKSRIGWTADAGVTYGITQRIGIGADARYIGYRPASGPAGATVKLQLSPVIYSLGLRWRF
jgi:outer membrane protein W